jgi:hypothetical protein
MAVSSVPLDDLTIHSVFADQVQAQFGGTNYRGLGEQEVSWRLLALGQTLPAHRDLVEATPLSRRLSRALDLPRSPVPTRDILDARQMAVGLQVWILERLPRALFVRLLERLQYPQVVYQAARNLWQEVTGWVSELSATLLEAGQRFLGGAQAVAARLRAGGLYSEEWEALNVLALGALGGPSAPDWLRELGLVLGTIRGWFAGHPRATPPDEARVRVRHTPLGLQVSTEWGERPLLYSALQVDGDTLFATCPEATPPAQSFAWLLDRHADRLALEVARRNALLGFSARVINLILTYIVLGPAGFIVMALRLLLAGLLRVTPLGRVALP